MVDLRVGQIRRLYWWYVFFFQAEDGIRDAQESRGLGDVYKRQVITRARYIELKANERLGLKKPKEEEVLVLR